MTDFQSDVEKAAIDESFKGYEWAVDNLKQTSPAISYEFGVRAGFKMGAQWARERMKFELISRSAHTCSVRADDYPTKPGTSAGVSTRDLDF